MSDANIENVVEEQKIEEDKIVDNIEENRSSGKNRREK
jgi:hypothetical protein